MKYAKIKNNTLEYAPRNQPGISNWINDEAAVLAEGYLPVELQEVPDGKYQVGYEVINNVIIRKLENAPKPTQESLSQARISGLESYLSATDWYVIRNFETGKDIPTEVKKARADARAEISSLRGDEVVISKMENAEENKI